MSITVTLAEASASVEQFLRTDRETMTWFPGSGIETASDLAVAFLSHAGARAKYLFFWDDTLLVTEDKYEELNRLLHEMSCEVRTEPSLDYLIPLTGDNVHQFGLLEKLLTYLITNFFIVALLDEDGRVVCSVHHDHYYRFS